MSEDTRSIVKKMESAVDDFIELGKRRKMMLVLVLLVIVAPAAFDAYLRLAKVPKLEADVAESTKRVTQAEEELRKSERAHSTQIAAKNSKIQELEAELAPFRAFAIQKFSSSNADSMRELAEHLGAVDSDLRAAEAEIRKVKAEAAYPKLRKTINIRPDGVEFTWMTGSQLLGGTASSAPSTIHAQLWHAFALTNAGKRKEAEAALRQITVQLPTWPYAYYYLGIITEDVEEFRLATECFTAIREAGIQEPDPLFVEALCLTHLDRFDECRQRLEELEDKQSQLSLIPIVRISAKTPNDLVLRIKKIAELNKRTAESPQL